MTVRPYIMKISRLTIDKLGVKLYDKVSAVVAELVANSYDADAENVTVRLPLGTALTKKESGKVIDLGYMIEVEDDGHGMTPDEAIDQFLIVGRNRRDSTGQGGFSRKNGRPVMGRKGIGKLAPFGVCKCIEVISSGGEITDRGYLTTHFIMNYDDIIKDSETDIPFEKGIEDRTYKKDKGTTIRLSNFQPKRIPDPVTFYRQLATRFVLTDPKFKIVVEDLRNPESNPKEIDKFAIPTMDNTKIDVANRPVVTDEGERLPVQGWLGLSKDSYKNEEMAGVRIYARDKIVAITRDFEQPAGYTGEFRVRSYLVGEVYAEWLDSDEGEDLIRSDRQGILWDSEYGRALRSWGAEIIKEIGKLSQEPRRKKLREIFIEKSNFHELVKDRYQEQEVRDVALELARQIGSFAAEDELEDQEYVDNLCEIILTVAPHKALIQAFQEFSKAVGNEGSIDKLLDLFGKARIAELASFGQIASERLQVIEELDDIVHSKLNESQFQALISRAPWLVDPTWTVITRNQALKTFITEFKHFWKERHGEDIELTIESGKKRPDFILVRVGYTLHVVEIKPSKHTLNDDDFSRIINYVYSFREFFRKYPKVCEDFSKGWVIDVVVNEISLKDLANIEAHESFTRNGEIDVINWVDFLARTRKVHEMFLEVRDKFDEGLGKD